MNKIIMFCKIRCFFSFCIKNHAESLSSIDFVKIPFLDPKRAKFSAKLDQKSEHGHVHHVPKAPSEGEILQKTKENPFF